MDKTITCHQCNTTTSAENISRRESCDKCNYDLWVCKNCSFYSPSSYNECKEPQAERVIDKEKKNFCDYFRPANQTTKNKKVDTSKLDDLFK